ncbi:hypothetical protein EYF80_012648 [Liparis tanakae]|uniref:Uncharacterized protein n=1 Tax=Liparis tanakae TaxID=230148 RepID=A0A4Z2IGM5_9TELE|nr:hypothetical protein EYF80_012648 [Liparis tanakae]
MLHSKASDDPLDADNDDTRDSAASEPLPAHVAPAVLPLAASHWLADGGGSARRSHGVSVPVDNGGSRHPEPPKRKRTAERADHVSFQPEILHAWYDVIKRTLSVKRFRGGTIVFSPTMIASLRRGLMELKAIRRLLEASRRQGRKREEEEEEVNKGEEGLGHGDGGRHVSRFGGVCVKEQPWFPPSGSTSAGRRSRTSLRTTARGARQPVLDNPCSTTRARQPVLIQESNLDPMAKAKALWNSGCMKSPRVPTRHTRMKIHRKRRSITMATYFQSSMIWNPQPASHEDY